MRKVLKSASVADLATDPPGKASVQSAAQRRQLGWRLAFLMLFVGSIGPTVGRAAFNMGVHPSAFTTGRTIFSFALLAMVLAITAPRQFRIDRHGLYFSVLAGLLDGFAVLAYFWGLLRVSASVSQILISINPLFVLFFLALRGEKFTFRNVVRLALSIVGIYLLVGPGGHVDGWGVFLILFAAFIYAGHLVVTQWFLRDYDPWQVTFYQFAGAVLAIGAFGLLQGIEWDVPEPVGWIFIGAIVLIALTTRIAAIKAIQYLGSGQLALLWPLSLLLTIFWSMLFLSEQLSAIQWFGGLMIITSALLASRRIRRVRGFRRSWRSWLRS